jgi:hypothetical protein
VGFAERLSLAKMGAMLRFGMQKATDQQREAKRRVRDVAYCIEGSNEEPPKKKRLTNTSHTHDP